MAGAGRHRPAVVRKGRDRLLTETDTPGADDERTEHPRSVSSSKETAMSATATLPDPNFVLLYVNSPADSAAFYARLLGKPAVEVSPTFALFALASGTMLGLWAAHTVQPAATAVGGAELAFAVDSITTVQSMHSSWVAKGLPIAQAPTAMDFGFTFVALDPDGHRLRVFAPGAA